MRMERRERFLLILSFLLTSSLPIVAEPNTEAYLVIATALVLREEASTNSRTVEVLKKGDAVILIEKSSVRSLINGMQAPWFRVQSPSFKKGFVFSGYLKRARIVSEKEAWSENQSRCLTYNCRRETERNLLARLSFLHRSERKLTVTCSNGRKIEYNDGDPNGRINTAAVSGYVSEINFLEISAQADEVIWTQLINMSQCTALDVRSSVIVSPDRKRIVIPTPIALVPFNDVEIYRLSRPKPTLEFKHDYMADLPWQLFSAAWISNREIVLRGGFHVEKGFVISDRIVKLKDGGWNIEPAP